MLSKIDREKEHEHRVSGNGWAIVQEVNPEYVRVVSLGKNEVGTQAFLAFRPHLTPRGPILPELFKQCETLRNDLARGKKLVQHTHIVNAR